jgi:hypothetical protein
MSAKKKNRPNAKGRSNTCRFMRLDHYLLESAAYRSLSPNARSLLVELAMIDNGNNNGAIWLSVKDAAARMGLANLTSVSRAFSDLAEAGFIRLTKEAHFSVKASSTARARCWRLTWLPVPNSRGPTNEWRDYEPTLKTAGRRRMDEGQKALKRFRKIQSEGKTPVSDLHTLEPQTASSGPVAVYELHTGSAEKGQNQPISSVYNSHTYTAASGVRGDGAKLEAVPVRQTRNPARGSTPAVAAA